MDMKLNLGTSLTYDPALGLYDACENVVPLAKMIPENHTHLLNFLNADIEGIIETIKESVSEKDPLKSAAAYEKLIAVHPFFADNPAAASAYINRELASSIWQHDKENSGVDQELFHKLAIINEEQSDNIDDWLVNRNADGYGCLAILFKTQDDIRDIVALLLDESNPELSSVPFSIRSGIYGLLSLGEPSISHPKAKIVLSYPKSMRILQAQLEFEDLDDRGDNTWARLVTSIRRLEEDSAHIPDVIRKIVSAADDASDTVSYIEYSTETLEEILYLEVYLMLQNGIRFNRCQNCGRFYPVAPGVETPPMCDIPDSDGSSCRSRFLKKEQDKRLSKIYRRSYRTHYSRVQTGKESEEELDKWRKNMLQMKKMVSEGKISEAEFAAKLI